MQTLKQTIAVFTSTALLGSQLHAVQIKVNLNGGANSNTIRHSLTLDKVNNRGRTSIVSSSNNVPIVNIAKPNTNRVSHNKFIDYNVNKEGLILNNSGKKSQTKLAGEIERNPNLGKDESAVLIINEVTSSNPTHLNGFTEVAGNKADVIVANPNGIKVNGGGFINTARATLVTGKVEQEGKYISQKKEGALKFKMVDFSLRVKLL